MADITTVEALFASFREAGYTDAEARQLSDMSRTAVRFEARLAGDDAIPVGASKLSGLPDLGGGQSWPVRPVYENLEEKLERMDVAEDSFATYDNVLFPKHVLEGMKADHKAQTAILKKPFPLFFVAQINFADAAEIDADLADWMPASGVLSVFFDLIEQPWGYDPLDKVGFRLMWSEGDLKRQALPDELRAYEADSQKRHTQARDAAIAAKEAAENPGLLQRLFGSEEQTPIWVPPEEGERLMPPAHALDAVAHITMPSFWQLSETAPDLTEKHAPGDETDTFYDKWAEELGPSTHHTQVGGWPSDIQNPDMGFEAELLSNGIYLGDGDGYTSAEAQRLRPAAKDWVLLAQIGSGDGVWMWADSGILYVWIRRQDLAARDFDKAWLILQSY